MLYPQRKEQISIDFIVRTIYNKCVDKKGGADVSPSQGRPPIEHPKTERLHIRVTPEEKAEIHKAAKETGLTLLELIRKAGTLALLFQMIRN